MNSCVKQYPFEWSDYVEAEAEGDKLLVEVRALVS